MTLLLEKPIVATEPAGKVCPLCQGTGEPWGEKDGFAIRVCDCVPSGVLLSFPYASAAEYERLYTAPAAYHEEMQRQGNQLPSLLRDTEHLTAARCRLEMLRQWVPPPASLLDIGAGTGAFVAQAEAFGYDAAGFDPCREMVEFGRRLGRNLSPGIWKDLAHYSSQIVCLHDVFEHLTQPEVCLRLLRVHLREWAGGLLVIEMPEFDAPNPAWRRHIRPLQHLCLWSDTAARELFRRCGLTVEASFRPCRMELGKITYWLSAP